MRHTFATLVLLAAAILPVWGQSAGLAEISGKVRDQTGAAVPDAQVVISNAAKGVRVELKTSSGGVFDAPALLPAAGYKVAVDKVGFAHYEVAGIDLAVGKNVGLPISLSLGGASAEVEVTAPVVDDTKTDVSQVIGSQQILELPINGRRVDSFVLLTPGVTNDGNYGLLTFRGVANGNTFLLDGNDSTEQFYGENNGRTRILSSISQDAVQEFQVVSANFSAEYGNAMGGVVNTVTRSGTNQYHGTGYWFFRNQDFDAKDAFASINPDEWRLQSGASLGGPIIKNRLFFFLNGDFTRRNFPIVDSYKNAHIDSTTEQFLPSSEDSLGCDPTVATPAQCSAINGLLPRFFGLVPRTVDQDLAFGRIDYNLSSRNTFSVSFNYMHFKSPNGLQATLVSSTTGAGVNSNGNDFARVRNGKASWTFIASPNLVNNFRYGWNTDLQGDTLNPALNGALGYLGLEAVGVNLGAVSYLPRIEPNEGRNELGDDLAWTHGRHVFKLGVDFATTNDYSYFIENANGYYDYSSLTDFAEDFSGNTAGAKNWEYFEQTFGNPAVNTRINYYGVYAEDQWKATDKLMVNFGGRYEYSQLPQPDVCNPEAPLTCHINSPNTNLMPRIGLAYRVNNKTVVRAGYGIFYARVMGATLQDLFTNNGVTTSTYTLYSDEPDELAAGPVFPNILPSAPAAGSLGAAPSIQFASPNFATPYSEQGILAVERELANNLTLTVSGIWSRGVHLYSEFDTNLPPPTNTTDATYTIENSSGASVGTYTTPVLLKVSGSSNGRPNPNFGGMYEDDNGVESFYDGLTVQLQKRFSHGFLADASYTWSHEIDDGQGYGQETQNIFLSNADAWLVNGDYRLDYGDGLEDQPQRFVLSWVWTPTFTQRDGTFYKYVVNNWEFSSITTIDGARPYGSPTIYVSGTPVTGMFSNYSINGYGLSGRVPFQPVSDVWQPASYRDDMRISKVLPFGDRYRLYLNFEIFNLSNSWSPTEMNTEEYTETGSCTATPSTCALKPESTYNTGYGDALNPDGTEARRLQVSARFTF